MDLDAAIARIHNEIQACMNDGLLPAGMLTSWHLAASCIDTDGEETAIMVTDDTSRLTQTLGLIEYARILLTDQIATWHDS